MSAREPGGQQAQALREALRRREQMRSQGGEPSRSQAGPPDLAEVFGSLFGLLAGKRRSTGGDRTPASADRSHRDFASISRAGARAGGGAPAGSWRERLQERLDQAKAQLEQMQAESARQQREEAMAPFAPDATPEPARPAAARDLRDARHAAGDQPPVLIPDALVPQASRPAMGRTARLRGRLRDASEVRELYVASVLLGPPLARRRRR